MLGLFFLSLRFPALGLITFMQICACLEVLETDLQSFYQLICYVIIHKLSKLVTSQYYPISLFNDHAGGNSQNACKRQRWHVLASTSLETENPFESWNHSGYRQWPKYRKQGILRTEPHQNGFQWCGNQVQNALMICMLWLSIPEACKWFQVLSWVGYACAFFGGP